MSRSETALLRRELVKVTSEYLDLQKSVAKPETAFVKRVEILEAENDRLRPEITELDRRLAKYENPMDPGRTAEWWANLGRPALGSWRRKNTELSVQT